MPNVEIHILPLLRDNYAYVLRDVDNGQIVVIDPSVSDGVETFLDQRGWGIGHIVNTHHHWDHVGGNVALREKYKCEILGNEADKERIPGLTHGIKPGDSFRLLGLEWRALDVPGHTIGHLAFYISELKALFCGDVLFGLGCGGIFEGTAAQMWQSLLKLRALPDDTKVYCGHEYTLPLSRFALDLDGENEELRKYVETVKQKRAENQPTVPFLLGLEKHINPFLQADSPRMQEILDARGQKSEDVFEKIYNLAD